MTRKRILFVSENVTLAQVVRLVTLANSLDPQKYEVHFASADFPEFIFGAHAWPRWPLWTVPAAKVFRSLESGGRLYSYGILKRNLAADIEVIRQVEPHLIVGDLRWSLAVSAPLCGVRQASLINAYWSRHAARDAFPLPDHPIVKLLGEKLAAQNFGKALPFVFKYFAAPLNKLRRQNGLAPLGDLLDVLVAGNDVLFADTPLLAPVRSLQPHQRYLGPVLWSPQTPAPDAWTQSTEVPKVYVTLGSSGRLALLPVIIKALAALPVKVLLASADRYPTQSMPANITAVDYVNGDEASRGADIVITNGGSSTGYQAIAQGRPVIGIPSNFDQYLASQAIAATGAGLTIPARQLTPARLAEAVADILRSQAFRARAAELSADMAQHPSGDAFAKYVAEATA